VYKRRRRKKTESKGDEKRWEDAPKLEDVQDGGDLAFEGLG
jgi:hypothetical protein